MSVRPSVALQLSFLPEGLPSRRRSDRSVDRSVDRSIDRVGRSIGSFWPVRMTGGTPCGMLYI